jgi:BNR/Asp-box repeat
MRSPESDVPESVVLPRTPSEGDVTPKEPPGGKAFERLLQFERARGQAVDDELVPSPSPRSRRRTKEAKPDAAADTYARSGDRADTREMADDLAHAMAETDPAELAVGLATAWRPLGPTVMRNGQTYGQGIGSRVDVSGRVAAIAVDPKDRRHVLVGAAGGGVWESRDTGATWTPRGDGLATLTVGALCFDPHTVGTVYLGTGEGDAYARLGQGVYRSTDGGATWSLAAGAPFIGVGFYQIVADPNTQGLLFAASRAGLYISSNGGTTWAQARGARCWSISVHPAGSATEVLAGCLDGLFRSTDAGSTWNAVTLPGTPNPANIRRLAVSHAPTNGEVAWAWAATDPLIPISPTQSQPTPRLWRRTTAGGGFSALSTNPGQRTGQASYDWHAHGSPASDASVYVGEINLYRVDVAANTVTWSNLSSKVNGDSIHPDQHTVAFDPVDPAVLYAGCDGGIFRSPDQGLHWTDLNDGLAITEIEFLAQDPGSSRWLLAGTQDNGTIRYVGQPIWDHVADGDGGDCGVNSVNPDVVYHEYYRMAVARSEDRGQTWRDVATGDRDPNVYRQLFYPPLEASGSTVAQAGESVFISRDSALTFTEVPLPDRSVASAMTMPSADTIYLGTTDGRAFRISWTGAAWQAPVELASPRSAYLSDLYVDPANPSRMWATSTFINGGRVFRSDNGGSSWSDCSAGLPNLPINAVEVDPRNANRVWAAADKGVWESIDGGSSWHSISLGLPNAIAADLLYHRHARVLRAGTRNRGVWEYEVERLTEPRCGVQWTGTLQAGESRRWFTFRWPASWHVLWTVMPTTVLPGAPELGWDVQVERADAEYVTYWITVSNRTDQAVSFEGRYAITSYR